MIRFVLLAISLTLVCPFAALSHNMTNPLDPGQVHIELPERGGGGHSGGDEGGTVSDGGGGGKGEPSEPFGINELKDFANSPLTKAAIKMRFNRIANFNGRALFQEDLDERVCASIPSCFELRKKRNLVLVDLNKKLFYPNTDRTIFEAVDTAKKETLEEMYEPFLIQEGFIQKTPRGRMITEFARRNVLKDMALQASLF